LEEVKKGVAAPPPAPLLLAPAAEEWTEPLAEAAAALARAEQGAPQR